LLALCFVGGCLAASGWLLGGLVAVEDFWQAGQDTYYQY
jgi:hypothetical protein